MSEPKPLVAAIDYETFYSKEYSIRDLGNWAYCHHPLFDPYMLTVATDRGDKWFGDPLDFQFEDVDGAIWIMANAGFDTTVTETLQEQGRIFNAKPAAIYDVLDLARYLGYPGNLAGAAEHMLGKKLNKGVRDAAKGKKWRDMTQARRYEMSAYAMADANVTLEIWLKYGHLWPEWERKLSDLTRRMCREGLPVDLAGIETDIQSLETLLWKVRTQIPWKIEEDGKGALSKKSMAEECRKNGILPPKSMAKDSEEFDGWLRVHGENFTWARAMGSYRSINGQLKRLRSMKARTIDNEDGTGRMVYGLKYAGAHTLRDSGDAGVNVQNFARDFMFEKELREAAGVSASIDPETGKFHEEPDKHYGIDMRGKIAAPKGFKLGVVDLSAIEPCCLAVLSGDEELAQLLRDGMDVYEGQARLDGEYDDPRPLKDVDKRLRQFNKVKVLGCLAVDTLILTEEGYLPASAIAENKSGLRIWDGLEWVHHEGYLDKGWQKTIHIRGEQFTPDHKIFISDTQCLPAGALCSRAAGPQLPWRPTPGSDWQDVRCLARGVLRALAQEWVSCSRSLLHKLRKHLSSRKLGQFTNRQVPRMRGVRAQAGFKNPNSTGMGARN